MRRYVAATMLLVFLTILLAACASEGTATQAVEKYIKAKFARDEDKLAGLSCADWEARIGQDIASVPAQAEITSISCTSEGKQDGFTLVTCSGAFRSNYDGENTEGQVRDLPAKTYRATKEDGEWKMCGYPE